MLKLMPDTGLIEVEGQRLTHMDVAKCNLISSCPQHDVLWPQLTAREHLTFYGRLKQIKASLICRSSLLIVSGQSGPNTFCLTFKPVQ